MRFPLILAFFCVVQGPASAQVNLLPQGNFENPGIQTGWAEGFHIPNNQECQVVLENGKHWLRMENRDARRQLDFLHAYVKVNPQIASLTVSVRMKATNLKIGKEGWHTARVALMFEGGSFGYPTQVPELRADSDWVSKSVELKVPAGATPPEHPARDVLLHRRVRNRRPYGHAPHGRRQSRWGTPCCRQAVLWTGTRPASKQ